MSVSGLMLPMVLVYRPEGDKQSNVHTQVTSMHELGEVRPSLP